MRKLFGILFTISFSWLNAQCVDPNTVYSFMYNGHNYQLVKDNKTWTNAATCAIEIGGYLAEINDVSEQNAIYLELSTNAGIVTSNTTAPDGGGASYVWIGGNDLDSEGDWIWDGDNDSNGSQFWQGNASGSPVGGLYNNWGNEPDNYGSGQNCLGLALTNWPYGVAGQWNDIYESNTLYYLIEIEMENLIEEGNIKFEVYPNPTNEEIHFNNPTSLPVSVILFNLRGDKLETWKIESGKSKRTTSHLTSGNYFLRIGEDVISVIVE
jgi:hypothetical protein